jgi:protein TonB
MPRDLFGEVTRPSISIGNRKWYTLPLSLVSHSAVVAILIALPILAPAVMPSVFADGDLTLITAIVPPAPPPPPRLKPVEITAHPPASTGAPTVAPTGINPELPASDPPLPDIPGVVGGTENLERVLAPPPPLPPPPAPQKALHVGGAIRPPQKLREVNPVYPPIAQAARIQGIVIIEATIGADGRVVDARVLRSVPMLDQAALDAVRQWEYTPTMLNGVPVPVIMTVTVQFTLSR